jgi:hypothetical protein
VRPDSAFSPADIHNAAKSSDIINSTLDRLSAAVPKVAKPIAANQRQVTKHCLLISLNLAVSRQQQKKTKTTKTDDFAFFLRYLCFLLFKNLVLKCYSRRTSPGAGGGGPGTSSTSRIAS